jgi:ankyrin repeat protein
MIRLLLNRGADVNVRAVSGNTPLLIACIGGSQEEIIKMLLQHGADVLTKNRMDETPLMYAAVFGDASTIRLLLSKGVAINAISKAGMTALSFAVKHENAPAVLSLLENGANANLPDGTGSIPFSYAAILDPVIAVAVLNKTTDVNTVDVDGNSLLMWAVYNEHDSPDLIRLLLKRGALVNKKAKDGSTALSWALKRGNTETVEILKNAGAK